MKEESANRCCICLLEFFSGGVAFSSEDSCKFNDFDVNVELREVFHQITLIESESRWMLCDKCHTRLLDAYLLRLQTQNSVRQLLEVKPDIKEEMYVDDDADHFDVANGDDDKEITPATLPPARKRRKKRLKPKKKGRPGRPRKKPVEPVELLSYECDLCAKVFEKKLEIARHMRESHKCKSTLLCYP